MRGDFRLLFVWTFMLSRLQKMYIYSSYVFSLLTTFFLCSYGLNLMHVVVWKIVNLLNSKLYFYQQTLLANMQCNAFFDVIMVWDLLIWIKRLVISWEKIPLEIRWEANPGLRISSLALYLVSYGRDKIHFKFCYFYFTFSFLFSFTTKVYNQQYDSWA